MPTIITRNSKGSLLTPAQGDDQIAQSTRYLGGVLTLSSAHNRETLECDGTFTITLPDAATLQTSLHESVNYGDIGFSVTVANVGTGVITVDLTTAADTLAGEANGTRLLQANDSYTLVLNSSGGTADGYMIPAENTQLAIGQTVGVQGSSEDWTNSTTFADIGISFSNIPVGVYVYDLYVDIQALGGGGFKIFVPVTNITQGSKSTWLTTSLVTPGKIDGISGYIPSEYPHDATWGSGGDYTMKGLFTPVSATNSINVQAAQESANASTLSIRTGSYMILTRIS